MQEVHQQIPSEGPRAFDLVRRKYLSQLQHQTGRNTILYATRWTQDTTNIPPSMLMITLEDIQGLMEVMHGMAGGDLDIILHSPGGSPEATEAVVSYLRSKFANIRVIIPQFAKSAATMLACSADKIVMGKHSFIGPIDPQLVISTPMGQQMMPAQAILDQFDKAKIECTDPGKMAAWMPMLGQYGPSLLTVCDNVIKLSKNLVQAWLSQYMFKGLPTDEAQKKAEDIAAWLGSHNEFMSHNRNIPRETARDKGLFIDDLEADQNFQDCVLSVFHATTITFGSTGAAKIIENHMGKSYVNVVQQIRVIQGAPGGGTPPGGTP